MGEFEGLRVFRGPDWKGEDADGGEGYLGTVIQSLGNHTVRVLWDMGQESTCSAGTDGKFELRVYDTAQAGVRHPDTTCAECGDNGIWGMLWRCQDCAGCDLCTTCYSDDKHDIRHRFLRIDTPGCEGQPFPKRKISVKIRAIGIFPGAKVVRGKDWEWADQDGGQGSEGEVTGFEAVPSLSCRSLVKVQWPCGQANSYRLGFRGKVDLKCVEEEVGPEYYRDHLPLLDTTRPSLVVGKTSDKPTATNANDIKILQLRANSGDVTAKAGKTTLTGGAEGELSVVVGDRVAIRVGEEELRELQISYGGCTDGLVKCIGATGTVLGMNRSVHVNFGSNTFNYKLNPQALLKDLADSIEPYQDQQSFLAHLSLRVGMKVAKQFAVNDMVRIRDDLDLLRILSSRIIWVPDMDKTAGKVGQVCSFNDEGVMVDFGECQYAYAPACCVPAPGATPDHLKSRSGRVSAAFSPAYESKDNEKMAMFRALRSAVKAGDIEQALSSDEFFAAVEFGDLTTIRQMCQKDPSMVERENQGITPLIFASLRGKMDSSVTLMDLGADVNKAASTDHRKTPLSASLEGRTQDMAELLLSRGGDVKYTYTEGKTLTHLAAIRNQEVILKALAKYGADMNAKDYKGDTPLHLAIIGREQRGLEALLAIPQVDLNARNARTFRPLQLACLVDNPRAVAGILARDKSQVNEMIGQGHSAAIHVAAINGHIECVRLLVMEGGANVNMKQGHSQQTALHLACHKGRLETVEALLELGAEVNVEDSHGDSPFHLTMGGKIDGYGSQTEHVAMQVTCRIEIAKMLISGGAYVDVKNHTGRNPLAYGFQEVKEGVRAFMANNKDVVKRKFGPDMDSDRLFSSTNLTTSSRIDGGQISDALKGVGLPCGVCGSSKSDITLQPCQHKCLCSTCSDGIIKCPLCDVTITDKVNTGQDDKTLDPTAALEFLSKSQWKL